MGFAKNIRKAFDMAYIAGEVEGDIFREFEIIRKKLKEKNLKYEYYFKSKQNMIRIFAKLFIKYTDDYIKLLEKMEEEE